MQNIKVVYGGSDDRTLQYVSNKPVVIPGDGNSVRLSFIIPPEYAGWGRLIEFDVQIKDEEGELFYPTYILDENDSILIPYEIASVGNGGYVTFRLILNNGLINSPVVEVSEGLSFFVERAVDFLKTVSEFEPIVMLKAVLRVTYTDSTQANGTYVPPKLTITHLNGQYEIYPLNDFTTLSSAIAGFDSRITAEVNRATAVETALDTKITGEINRATTSENTIDAKATSEITRAISAETTLGTSITNEITRATTAESALNVKIENETARASTAESALSTQISNEAKRADDAEKLISASLTTETNRAVARENEIEAEIAGIGAMVDVSEISGETEQSAYTFLALAKYDSEVTENIQTLRVNSGITVSNTGNSITATGGFIGNASTATDLVSGAILSKSKGGTGYSSFDTSPTANSLKAITSDGVYQADTVLDGKITTEATTRAQADSVLTSAVTVLQSDVDILKGRNARYLVNISSTSPTEAELTEAFQEKSGLTTPIDGTILESSVTSIEWMWFSTEPEGQRWVNRGVTTVSRATNSTYGIIKGNAVDGGVIFSTAGLGEVQGWSTIVTGLSSVTALANSTLQSLNNEIAEREDEDTAIRSSLSTEVTRATNAESALSTSINSEITRATNAESALNTSISNEVTRATGAENTLDGKITAETSRANAEEQRIATALSTEVTRATTAETANNTLITTETTRAVAKDTELETAIDNLESGDTPAGSATKLATAVDMWGFNFDGSSSPTTPILVKNSSSNTFTLSNFTVRDGCKIQIYNNYTSSGSTPSDFSTFTLNNVAYTAYNVSQEGIPTGATLQYKMLYEFTYNLSTEKWYSFATYPDDHKVNVNQGVVSSSRYYLALTSSVGSSSPSPEYLYSSGSTGSFTGFDTYFTATDGVLYSGHGFAGNLTGDVTGNASSATDLATGSVLSKEKGGTGYADFDTVPTQGSLKAVTSDGIYTAIQQGGGSVSPATNVSYGTIKGNAVSGGVIFDTAGLGIVQGFSDILDGTTAVGKATKFASTVDMWGYDFDGSSSPTQLLVATTNNLVFSLSNFTVKNGSRIYMLLSKDYSSNTLSFNSFTLNGTQYSVGTLTATSSSHSYSLGKCSISKYNITELIYSSAESYWYNIASVAEMTRAISDADYLKSYASQGFNLVAVNADDDTSKIYLTFGKLNSQQELSADINIYTDHTTHSITATGGFIGNASTATDLATGSVLSKTKGGTGYSEFDTAPTSGSDRAVTSGGVYTTIQQVATNKLDATKCTFQTTEPTSAISDSGVHIVYLSSEPATKYDGYIYLIAESS